MGTNYEKPRVVTYSYPTLQSTTEYQRFSNEYFTGADVRLYFGDVWVDEITSISFDLTEQVQPIFGYASYTFDKVARGSRMVRGSFSINFKESFYLQGLMNSLESKLEEKQAGTGNVFTEENFKQGLTVEHVVEQLYSGKNFGAIADELEKSFWGQGQFTTQVDSKNNGTYFNANSNSSVQGLNQSKLAEDGFNILITYGPYNEKDGVKAAGSAVTIVGVQLTGVQQVIGGDGNPIQEQYEFLAKDLNGRIN